MRVPPGVWLMLAAGCGGSPPGPPAPPAPAAPVPARPVFPVPPPRLGRTRPFQEEPPFRKAEREAMVERQLRSIGVTDEDVLRAMAALPRHLFVPEDLVESAYDDTPLPIGHGQTISAPDVVGYMTQALGVRKGARVLDVGTGSGYQAGVLAEMGCRVFSIEILDPLARTAAARLADLGYEAVTVRTGDGYAGWPEEAPFDGILVAAAPEEVPEALVGQLKPGARLVLPVGKQGEAQRLLVLTKRADGGVDREETLAVRFVPMVKGR